MPLKTYLYVEDATGRITGTVSRLDDAPGHGAAPAEAGFTYVDVTGQRNVPTEGTYDLATGRATLPLRTPTLMIDAARFFDLFTFDQRSATFDLVDAADKQVRDLMNRVNTGAPINLLSPRVALGLALLKSKGVFGADATVADASIARILRNELP